MSLVATGTQVAWHDPGAAEADKCCCSPSGCCPYPSSLGSTDETDWPATVVVNGTTLNLESGAPNTPTYSNGSITLWKVDSSRFQISFASGDLEGAIYTSGCLFGDYSRSAESDPGFPATVTVEDQFNATYTVSFDIDAVDPEFGPAGDPQHYDVVVTRDTLCRWYGEPESIALPVELFPPSTSAGTTKWTASISDAVATKDIEQKEPQGDYPDVVSGGSWLVTNVSVSV